MAGSSQDHANAITNILNVVVGLPLLLVEEVAETAYEIVNGVVNLAAIPLNAIVPGLGRPLLRNRGMTPSIYNRPLALLSTTMSQSSIPGSTWARTRSSDVHSFWAEVRRGARTESIPRTRSTASTRSRSDRS